MFLYSIVALAVALIVGGLVWRGVSRRHALPCPVWLRWLVEMENPFFKIYQTPSITGLLGLAPGMRVLDAGCGPGRVTVAMARLVGPEGEVTALDVQEGMLRRAREKAAAAGLANIRFLLAGLGEGKLEQGIYDRAVLATVLGEIPDRESALREIYGALKPGGILSVTEIIMDPHYTGREKAISLATGAGFVDAGFWGGRWAYTIHFAKPA